MSTSNTYLKIKNNWDNLAKPIDGLGEFENVLSKIGAVQGSESIFLDPATLLIFISDNGVTEEGISQSDSEVTYEVAKALGKGISTVSHMAKAAHMNVVSVNVGIKHKGEIEGVLDYCVINGTANFLKKPAMTEDEFEKAINVGREMVVSLKESGCKVLALGEMGIGNTTTSAACLAGIKKLYGKNVCSKGAGLSDSGLKKKINVVDEAIIKYNLHNMLPMEILRTVGGLDIAALVGAILESCNQGIPVISDGFITGVAALFAYECDKRVKDIIVFSHRGRERGMKYILDEFDAKPVISADMALGEGTGTCIFLSAARCALSVYEGNTQFKDINTDNYKRFK
ncbi:MAG: nicotinate-nucleotide--dimethylbenzimidazole phosphoribosyltransferase [Lachnospiraceae bacterium]|nr:nicotinate-nucleotide--dimethylbenzimidazole phosphoribosyltransferase [Lachnospiraceae bacterium]